MTKKAKPKTTPRSSQSAIRDVPFALLSERAILPSRATEHSAGFDLYLPTEATIPTHFRAATLNTPEYPIVIDFEVAVVIPLGHVGLLSLRSSIGAKGLVIPNSPGIIDPDYRGSLKLIVANLSPRQVFLPANSRVAQLTIVPAQFTDPIHLDPLPKVSSSRSGGLGSTGE